MNIETLYKDIKHNSDNYYFTPESLDYLLKHRYPNLDEKVYEEFRNYIFYEKNVRYVYDVDNLLHYKHQYYLKYKSSQFIFNNSLAIPLYDIQNNIIGYETWNGVNSKPKYKLIKYDDFGFSSKYDYYNIDSAFEKAKKFDNKVIIVEGMFDTLVLDFLGFPVLGNTTSSIEAKKGELLRIFNKVYCLPDNDKVGHKARKMWKVPYNSVFINIKDTENIRIKDIDDAFNYLGKDYLIEEINKMLNDRKIDIFI